MYNNGIWNEVIDKQWMAAARQEVRIFHQKITTGCTVCDQLVINLIRNLNISHFCLGND